MTSGPGVLLAHSIAARRLPGPESSVLSTTKVQVVNTGTQAENAEVLSRPSVCVAVAL